MPAFLLTAFFTSDSFVLIVTLILGFHLIFIIRNNRICVLDLISQGLWELPVYILETLRNENEDKTKTQMTQLFNQYCENETKIWRQIIQNQFNRVSSSCLRSHFVISLLSRGLHVSINPGHKTQLWYHNYLTVALSQNEMFCYHCV